MKKQAYEFWFLVGSQHLYGPEAIRKVDEDAAIICQSMTGPEFPHPIVYKGVVQETKEITAMIREANYSEKCAGIITWMHTFSPSKMWIPGLSILNKPYLHLHTQFNRNIPYQTIDMDYMNLHQSAHGDREHSFAAARLGMARKVVVGFWQDAPVRRQIGEWTRIAVGSKLSKTLKIVRFGDNMREVAVTEGDKIEALIKMGWTVDYYGVGDLVKVVDAVSEAEIDLLVAEYQSQYKISTDDLTSIRYQARLEAGIGRFLEERDASGFTTNFEDLQGLAQLPGLAVQRLMAKGYGFGGEGDWKTAALVALVKAMGGSQTSFMEDYTYDLEAGHERVMGAHMLEVCPSIAGGQPSVEVHDLGIGGKDAPARLVFEARPGRAVCATLIDIGGRMRLIVNEIEVIENNPPMPKLPVARAIWQPLPNFHDGVLGWLLAGGGHHSVLTYSFSAENFQDWAEIMGIECVLIGEKTSLDSFKQNLFLADLAWKLK